MGSLFQTNIGPACLERAQRAEEWARGPVCPWARSPVRPFARGPVGRLFQDAGSKIQDPGYQDRSFNVWPVKIVIRRLGAASFRHLFCCAERHSLYFDPYFQFVSLIFRLSTFSFALSAHPASRIQYPVSRIQYQVFAFNCSSNICVFFPSSSLRLILAPFSPPFKAISDR